MEAKKFTETSETDPVTCSVCDKVLQKGGLRNHVALVHFNITNYKCDTCGARFGHDGRMKAHMREAGLQVRTVRCSLRPAAGPEGSRD